MVSRYFNFKTILLVVLVVLGAFLRFFLLEEIPVGLYHDELDYVLTGEAILRFGTDVGGDWRPYHLQPLQTYNVMAELPAVFQAITQFFFGSGMKGAHVTGAIFSLMSTLVVGFLFYLLFQNRQLAVISALIFWLSPLFVYISRTGYEVNITLWGQLLFLCSFVYLFFPPRFNFSKSLRRVLAILALVTLNMSFFLAFFTYHAAKFSLPVMALTGLIFSLVVSPYRRRRVFWAGVVSLVLTVGFCLGWSFFNEPLLHFRQNETIFNAGRIETIFQEASRERLTFFGDRIFLNRYSSLIIYLLNQYLYAFDFSRLMTGYESGYQFSLAVHGFFFWSSLLMGVVGVVVIITTTRGRMVDSATLWLWVLLVLVAPVATMISISSQSIFRSYLLYVLLIYPVARGWLFLWQWIGRKKLLTLLVAGVIVVEVVYFGYTYFTFFPVKTADNFSFAHRLLAGYLAQVKKEQPKRLVILALSHNTYEVVRGVVFYNQLLPQLTLTERAWVADADSFKLTLGPFLTVTNECPMLSAVGEEKPVIIYDYAKAEDCKLKSWVATAGAELADEGWLGKKEENDYYVPVIASPRDSGGYYYLWGDTLCTQFALPKFIHQVEINHYQAEKLDPETYCRSWVRQE
jgi:hypothetical protein